MGGHAWWYVVPYQRNIKKAMHELREREFRAGRYNPVVRYLDFPLTERSAAPGARHASIEEAMAETDAEGTRSILDMFEFGERPGTATMSPLEAGVLRELYGTTKPTREQVEPDLEFFEEIERGEGRYVVLYRDGKPDEILFAGFSFD